MGTQGRRIAALRKERGLSGRALAKLTGGKVTQGLISQLELGLVHGISGEKLAAVAKALGVSIDYLISGKRKGGLGPLFIGTWEITDGMNTDPIQFFLVPKIEPPHPGEASTSREKGDGRVDDALAVSGELVRRAGLNPRNLGHWVSDSDAMAPKIGTGDAVIIDLHDTAPANGVVFLLSFADAFHVRRVFTQPDGNLLLQADNPNHPAITTDRAQISILGRVHGVQSLI